MPKSLPQLACVKAVFTLLSVMIYLHGTAQPSCDLHRDYIVLNNYDTIQVSIAFPESMGLAADDTVSIHDKLIATNDYCPSEFYPEDIKAFKWNGYDYESISWKPDSLTVIRKFCIRLLSGEITVFRYDAIKRDTSAGRTRVPVFIFCRDNECHAATLSQLDPPLSHFVWGLPRPIGTISMDKSDPASWITIVRRYNENLRPKTSH